MPITPTYPGVYVQEEASGARAIAGVATSIAKLIGIAELCRKEGINQNLYYGWSKEFLEAGKMRLAGDTAREANSDEVKGLRNKAAQLKEALEDVRPNGGKAWNRLPETIRQSILTRALERSELSSPELAVLYTEQQRYFVSESSVYRLLKAHDLITSPKAMKELFIRPSSTGCWAP